MGTTVRRIDRGQGGNRVVTRTAASFEPGTAPTEATLARAARVHRAKFDARFPRLRGVGMEHAWADHLALTRNGVAVTGEIDHGLWSACVCNGLGATRSTLTGVGAAEGAMGVETDVSRHFAAEPAPPRLPPAPLASLGATAVLRWKERRAGRE